MGFRGLRRNVPRLWLWTWEWLALQKTIPVSLHYPSTIDNMDKQRKVTPLSQSSQFQVARAATLLMVISVVGKLLGFAREQAIAGLFGATRMTDAYVTAFTLPQMIAGLIGGAVSSALLPVFSRYLAQDDRRGGWGVVGAISRVTVATLLLLVCAAFIAAPWLVQVMAPRFTLQEQAATVTMLRTMAPTALFLGMAAVFAVLLNAHKQFGGPALSPLLMNVGIIGAVMLLAGKLGIGALAWATLAGALLQVAYLAWQLRRQQVPWLTSGLLRHPGVIEVGRLALPIVVGSLFGQLYMVIDKGLASGLDAGSIAAMNYAAKLVQLPVGIFVTALATAIYPTLAEHAGRGDHDGLKRSVSSGLRLLTLVMLPAAVGLIVLRTPIVSLAFQRGSFDSVATAKTATALAFYAIGVLGVANQQILTRAFYVLSDSITPVAVGIGSSLLNIGLAFWLVRPLQHGGLALANSIATLVNMAVLMMFLRRKVGSSLGVVGSLVKIALAAGVMGGVVLFAYPLLASIGRIAALAGSVSLGVVVYFVMIALLGVEEMRVLTGMVKKRLGRGVRAA